MKNLIAASLLLLQAQADVVIVECSFGQYTQSLNVTTGMCESAANPNSTTTGFSGYFSISCNQNGTDLESLLYGQDDCSGDAVFTQAFNYPSQNCTILSGCDYTTSTPMTTPSGTGTTAETTTESTTLEPRDCPSDGAGFQMIPVVFPAFPFGICANVYDDGFEGSYTVSCDDDGDAVQNFFFGNGCNGQSIFQEPFDADEEIVVNCNATGLPCSYAVIRVYDEGDENATSTTTTTTTSTTGEPGCGDEFYEFPLFVDICVNNGSQSRMITCDDTSLTATIYDSDDCSGDVASTEDFLADVADGGCGEVTACYGATTTTTAEPTQEPTQQPDTTTTTEGGDNSSGVQSVGVFAAFLAVGCRMLW